jgi:thioredoxin-like negative regulator of GroEL
MMPIVDGLEAEFAGQVAVVRLNVAVPANEALQQSYGLRGHPAFAVLDRNNQVVARFMGPQTAATLRQAMEEL